LTLMLFYYDDDYYKYYVTLLLSSKGKESIHYRLTAKADIMAVVPRRRCST